MRSPAKRGRRSLGQVVRVFAATFVLAVAFTLLSGNVLRNTTVLLAGIVLLGIVFLGILFDVLGLAVAKADPAPLNAMAAKRTPGARHALRLIRNAPRVATFCNDLVGDISGTVSGAAGAAIVFRLALERPGFDETLWSVLMVGVIAAITVGGKAMGKTVALERSGKIVFRMGRVLWWLESRLRLVILPEPASRRGTRRETNSR